MEKRTQISSQPGRPGTIVRYSVSSLEAWSSWPFHVRAQVCLFCRHFQPWIFGFTKWVHTLALYGRQPTTIAACHSWLAWVFWTGGLLNGWCQGSTAGGSRFFSCVVPAFLGIERSVWFLSCEGGFRDVKLPLFFMFWGKALTLTA